MVMDNLRKVEETSVQQHWDAKKNNGAWEYQWYYTGRGPLLPAWGTRERERQLRLWYRNEYNLIGQGAIAALSKKVQSTPWEIRGKRGAEYFQELLMNADFGRGWGTLVNKIVMDYSRQDLGAFVEIIAPGNPLKPPTANVMGIAALDTLRCYPTGDPEYPVVYFDRLSKLHLMHNSRVFQFVDMLDGDDYNPGYGLSALSRAIKVVNEQTNMSKYVSTQLDDQPPPGILVASNLSDTKIKAILADYDQKLRNDVGPTLGRQVIISSLDMAAPAKLESVQFSTPPESWNYETYNNIHVNAWALALGVDVQEIWQLTGGNIGSSGQSEILHAKSQGRTFGTLLTEIERFINRMVLPNNLTFEFKRRDPQEAKERAEVANLWASFMSTVGELMTPDEKRRLGASMVESMKDAITDENGEVVRLPDNDVGPNDGTIDNPEVRDDANTPNNTEGEAERVIDDAEKKTFDVKGTTALLKAIADTKAIQATRLDFESTFEDVLAEARLGNITKARFSTLLRGMIARYGKAAYRDGLIDGGVTDGELDSDDTAAVALLLSEQSPYVKSFADTLYGAGVSDAEASGKPEMWFNKSISPFYDGGRYSADKNGMYEFGGFSGDESCATCRRLMGQRHRLKWWTVKRLRPRVDSDHFICRGFRCKHNLTRTTERATGRG